MDYLDSSNRRAQQKRCLSIRNDRKETFNLQQCTGPALLHLAVDPIKLETGLRLNGAGIPYIVLSGIEGTELMGFQCLGFYYNPSALEGAMLQSYSRPRGYPTIPSTRWFLVGNGGMGYWDYY